MDVLLWLANALYNSNEEEDVVKSIVSGSLAMGFPVVHGQLAAWNARIGHWKIPLGRTCIDIGFAAIALPRNSDHSGRDNQRV